MKYVLKKIRLVIFIIAGLYIIYFIVKENHAIKNSSILVNDTIPVEYENLIAKRNIGKLTNKDSHFSKIGRAPISEFDFKDKYHVIITKFKSVKDVSLLEMIQEVYRPAKITFQAIYEGFSRPYFELDYQIDEQTISSLSSKLYLTLNGDSVKTIVKNDTTAAYYLKMKNFAIQFQKDGLIDLIGEEKNNDNKIPVFLIFVKQKKSIYFLFISANDQNSRLETNLLHQLLN